MIALILALMLSTSAQASRICVGNFTHYDIQWELLGEKNEAQTVEDHHSWENTHGYLCAELEKESSPDELFQLNVEEKSPVGKYSCVVNGLHENQWVHINHAHGKFECTVHSDAKKPKAKRVRTKKGRKYVFTTVQSPGIPLGVASYPAEITFQHLKPYQKAAIYVSHEGKDTNPGTAQAPVKTIKKGQELLNEVSGHPAKFLFLDRGNYPAPLILTDEITIIGGYAKANGWARYDASDRPAFTASELKGVEQLTVIYGKGLSYVGISGLILHPDNSKRVSHSVYGIYCEKCEEFILKDTVIHPGIALDGADGKDGAPDEEGTHGSDGGEAIGVVLNQSERVEVSGCTISGGTAGDGGNGGKGGNSTSESEIGKTGGAGGNGGNSFAIYSNRTPELHQNTLKAGTPGKAGKGGAGGSPDGESGAEGFNGQVGLAP